MVVGSSHVFTPDASVCVYVMRKAGRCSGRGSACVYVMRIAGPSQRVRVRNAHRCALAAKARQCLRVRSAESWAVLDGLCRVCVYVMRKARALSLGTYLFFRPRGEKVGLLRPRFLRGSTVGMLTHRLLPQVCLRTPSCPGMLTHRLLDSGRTASYRRCATHRLLPRCASWHPVCFLPFLLFLRCRTLDSGDCCRPVALVFEKGTCVGLGPVAMYMRVPRRWMAWVGKRIGSADA